MSPRNVLLSERMAPSLPGLQQSYPDLVFRTIPMEGEFKAEYLETEILWMSALSDELFDRILADAPNLRWVQVTAAGFNWILRPRLEELMDQGLWVTRSVNSFNIPIAEYVVAAILSSARRFDELAAAQGRREWIWLEAGEIGGSHVVVVGTGAIGHEVAWRCRALGARVSGVSRSGAPAEHFDQVVTPDRMDELLADCDSLVVAAPLTPETEGMIGAAQFDRMKDGSLLINVGRGAVVDTPAMIDALASGRLSRAYVDVFEEEPLPVDSELWNVENLIATPHTSFRAVGNLARLEKDFRANLDRLLAGEALDGAMKSRVLGY